MGTCSPWSDNPLGRVTYCTSTTRPTGAARYFGQVIFEFDTGRWWYWGGSAWIFMPIAKVPRVSVTRSAAESMPTGFQTPTFDTENYDTDGMHSGSNNYLTVPAGFGGRWFVSYYISTGVLTTSGDAYVQINAAGKRYIDVNMANGSMVGATEIIANAGDSFWLILYNGTGTSTMVTNTNNYFQASYLGPV